MQTTVIDGRAYALEFAGFDRALRVQLDDGEAVELPPWPWARHLAGLRRHLRAEGGRLDLDVEGYTDEMLDAAGVAPTGREGLRSLALWWAHGIDPAARTPEPPPRIDEEGRAALGPGLWARLRPWTWGERLQAQRECLEGEPEGVGLTVDALGYLEAMVRCCLIALEREDDGEAPELAQLDAAATRRLCAAVVALNHPEGEVDPLDGLPPALAAATLRLCGALGWTLERALATPAPEIDRLLVLLDRVELGGARRGGAELRRKSGVGGRAGGRPRIADHPDAVVFLFEDGTGDQS